MPVKKDEQDNTILVTIDGKEYSECQYYSDKLDTVNKRKSPYNNGIVNNSEDERKAERVGLLGETAFGYLFSLGPDFSFRPKGIPYDFIINDKKIDVKTSIKPTSKSFIRVRNERGESVPMQSDLYVAAYLYRENRQQEWAQVIIVGGAWKKDLASYEIRKSPRGNWFNIELEYTNLIPINKLIQLI